MLCFAMRVWPEKLPAFGIALRHIDPLAHPATPLPLLPEQRAGADDCFNCLVKHFAVVLHAEHHDVITQGR